MLVFVCLPLQASASIAGIGVALLENKVIHAEHSQAIPGLAKVLEKARRDVQGTADVDAKQEASSAPSSEPPLESAFFKAGFVKAAYSALQSRSGPKSAVVVAIVVLAMMVMLVLMNMLITAGRRQASSVHWSSVGATGQPQSGSSLALPSAPGSARLLDGGAYSSKFSVFDAGSTETARFGSGLLHASSTQSIESGSTARLSYPYLNQKRAASSSSVASRISDRSAGNGSGSSDVLCPALIVQQQEGVKIECNGSVSADKQEGILDVSAAGRIIMRVLFSEFGLDSGILVESMMRAPIAFLNTTKAWASEESSNDRRVHICRSLPAAAPALGTDPFAVVMPDPDPLQKNCFQVRRGFTGPLLARVRLQANAMCVTSGEGLLMASLDARMKGTSLEQLRMHIQPNVDASLVVCFMLASMKLM